VTVSTLACTPSSMRSCDVPGTSTNTITSFSLSQIAIGGANSGDGVWGVAPSIWKRRSICSCTCCTGSCSAGIGAYACSDAAGVSFPVTVRYSFSTRSIDSSISLIVVLPPVSLVCVALARRRAVSRDSLRGAWRTPAARSLSSDEMRARARPFHGSRCEVSEIANEEACASAAEKYSTPKRYRARVDDARFLRQG
jgi:hypothetical protein